MLYSDYLKDKFHNAIKLNNVEGVPCILNHSKGKDLKNYEIYGNSYQATRSGKNLLSSNATTSTLNGVTLTYDNGTITLNGTCDTSANFDLNNIVLSAGTYTLSANANKVPVNNGYAFVQLYDSTNNQGITLVNSNAMSSITTTISDGTFLYRIRIDKGTTYDTVILKPQLEVGSTATEYEPYGVMPSPDYPSEVQSVGDLTTKNLIPYPYFDTTKTIKGVTITDNGDGSINLNGTSTGQVNFYFSQNLQLKKGITYTLSASGNYSFGGTASFYIYNSTYGSLAYISLNADNSYTFTPTKDINGINCYIVIPSNRTVIGTLKPQLELGSTATEYEPYHKYDIPITVTGKNLIPYPYYETTKTINGITFTTNGNGSVKANGTATRDAMIFLQNMSSPFYLPAGTYTISSGVYGDNAANKYGVVAGVTVDGVRSTKYSKNGYKTFRIDKKSAIDFLIIIRQGQTVSNLVFYPQLEIGTTATAYEPYIPPVTTHIYLDEPLRKVGDYADYIDFENRKVVRNIKRLECNGSEAWYMGNEMTNTVYFVPSTSSYPSPLIRKGKILSDEFVSYDSGVTTVDSEFVLQSVESFYVKINKSRLNSVTSDGFKSWLSLNNIHLYYILATPTEESISLPTLKTVKGTSIMTVDTSIQPSNIKAKYIRT